MREREREGGRERGRERGREGREREREREREEVGDGEGLTARVGCLCWHHSGSVLVTRVLGSLGKSSPQNSILETQITHLYYKHLHICNINSTSLTE